MRAIDSTQLNCYDTYKLQKEAVAVAWEGYTCGELLKRVSDIFETNANRDLQSHGVTLSQMKMLAFLDHTEDGSTTLKSLEAHFKVSQATIAGIAARLEKRAWCRDTSTRRTGASSTLPSPRPGGSCAGMPNPPWNRASACSSRRCPHRSAPRCNSCCKKYTTICNEPPAPRRQAVLYPKSKACF